MSERPYIATDDREIVRVDAACNHRRCPPGECIAYDAATLLVTEADAARGRELVEEGWWSTSAKRRTIERWKERPPTVEELFRPELLDTFHGQRLAAVVRTHVQHHYSVAYANGKAWPRDLFEEATLSPSLFKAFKRAGGDCGR